jgi:hypothetical protein
MAVTYHGSRCPTFVRAMTGAILDHAWDSDSKAIKTTAIKSCFDTLFLSLIRSIRSANVEILFAVQDWAEEKNDTNVLLHFLELRTDLCITNDDVLLWISDCRHKDPYRYIRTVKDACPGIDKVWHYLNKNLTTHSLLNELFRAFDFKMNYIFKNKVAGLKKGRRRVGNNMVRRYSFFPNSMHYNSQQTKCALIY